MTRGSTLASSLWLGLWLGLGLGPGLVACGGKSSSKDDAATPPGDGTQNGDGAQIDAPACVPPAALPACASPVSGSTVTMRKVHQVNDAALLVTAPTNDPRKFIVVRNGAIRVVDAGGTLLQQPFIDLNNSIVDGGERGLLGLAFHPDYSCNGKFYVFYTLSNANVVAACSVSTGDPNIANPTCTPILSIPDPYSNHNGGMMEFGSDRLLYIGTGDGGDMGDTMRNAQNKDRLLGKMLRIDVDGTSPGKLYGIPTDNPYAAGGGAPEVFMLGLRNPWRWSFDKATGDLWIGDVGQGRSEELNALPAGTAKGKNLGWAAYEGNVCCDTQNDNCTQTGTQYPCDPTGLTFPQEVRTHAQGWISMIAGEVYRGSCYPDLVGWHFYTDHASAAEGLHKARLLGTGMLEVVDLNTTLTNGAASLHADARGELYMTNIAGEVFHLEASP